jgi:hypothetical protein
LSFPAFFADIHAEQLVMLLQQERLAKLLVGERPAACLAGVRARLDIPFVHQNWIGALLPSAGKVQEATSKWTGEGCEKKAAHSRAIGLTLFAVCETILSRNGRIPFRFLFA